MLKLRDIMTTKVLTVRPDASIREVAELFSSNHIGGAPVVDRNRVIGVISASDILDFIASLSPENQETDRRLVTNPLEEHTVEEAMTRAPLRTLDANATPREAAALMREAGIHRVPVMEGDELVGMVSSLDLAKAVAEGRLSTKTLVFPHRSSAY